MTSVLGMRESGRAYSPPSRLSSPSAMKILPLPPLLSETPPTPNYAPPHPHDLRSSDLTTSSYSIHTESYHSASKYNGNGNGIASGRVTPSEPLSVPSEASLAQHRRSKSPRTSEVPPAQPRDSMVPGRSSSENTAVSIFSMYTDEAPIPEAEDETSSYSHANPSPRGSMRRTASPSELNTANGRADAHSSVDTSTMSLGVDSYAALLYMDDPKRASSASSHGGHQSRPQMNTRVSIPDSLYLPYDASPAGEPSEAEAMRRASTRSRSRPRSSRQPEHDDQRLSAAPSAMNMGGSRRTSTLSTPRLSSERLGASNRLSTSLAAGLALPPSRNESRASSRTDQPSPQPSEPGMLPALTSSSPFPSTSSPNPNGGPKHEASTSALTSHSQPLSHRGADEDADAEYVRSVYARFDVGGVAGDGYEEGLERTRARLPSMIQLADANAPLGLLSGDMNERETKQLRNLDRYGFFIGAMSVRQESRLALLSSAPLAKKVKRLKASMGPVPASHPASPPEIRKAPPDKAPTNELARLNKWQAMMQPHNKDSGGNTETWTPNGAGTSMATFKRRVWKGVPDRWRPAAWQMLIDDACKRSRSTTKQIDLVRQYRENIDVPSKHDVQIDLDVPRTVNDHVLFHTRYGQGQRSLFHILHCFSLRCESCEYCQGMGPIAATLLFYFNPERAYADIVRIHDEYGMHTVFQPGFPGLLEAIYVQERLVEQLMPAVYKSFQKNMISSTSYVTKWYITLFTNSFPFQTQLRIWDAFFLEGQDVIVVVAVAIIWALKDHLAAPQANFETILSLLSCFFICEDEDAFMEWIRTALESSEIRSAMAGWRKTWAGLVAQGKQHSALL